MFVFIDTGSDFSLVSVGFTHPMNRAFAVLIVSGVKLVVLGSSQSPPGPSWVNKGARKQNNNIDLRKDVGGVLLADIDAARLCFRRTKRRAAAASAGRLASRNKSRAAFFTRRCLVVMTPRLKQEEPFSHCDADRQPRTQTRHYTAGDHHTRSGDGLQVQEIRRETPL